MDLQHTSVIVAVVTGILGVITGSISLFLSVNQWRKSKPKLVISIDQATHYVDRTFVDAFPDEGDQREALTSFNVWLKVTNTGKEPTEIFEPRYALQWRGKAWSLGSHLSPVKGGSPQEEHRSKSAQIPGRGAKYLYARFSVPVEIREDVSALFGVTDGDGKEHSQSVISGWLNYEKSAFPGSISGGADHDVNHRPSTSP
jgi:hypothetical protein